MKKLSSALLLLSICIITALVLVRTTEPETLVHVLGTVNASYVYMGIAALAVYIVLESVMIYLMLNYRAAHRYSWASAFRVTVIGQYFNMVTPFSSGGQPMQLHAMVQEGIEIKSGTAVVVNKFLIFQIGITLYSFALVLVQFLFFNQELPAMSGLVYLGVSINFSVLLFMVLSIYRPEFLKVIAVVVLHGLYQLRIIRRKLHWINWMNHKIEDYTTHIREMIGMQHVMIPVILLTFVQLTAYFSIGWFVYLSLGLKGSSYLTIITLQALLYISVAFIPTPGSAGASEGGFYLIFASVYTQNTLTGAILLWRGISYYLSLGITGLITLGFTVKQMLSKHH